MKYINRFDSREKAEEFLKDIENAFIKKQSYEVKGSGISEKKTFWYIYPK